MSLTEPSLTVGLLPHATRGADDCIQCGPDFWSMLGRTLLRVLAGRTLWTNFQLAIRTLTD